MPESRLTLRTQCAMILNGLSRQQLLDEFAISRIGELTNLDTVGLPVFTATRALSATIAIHSGKGTTREASRAGAIAEAIEFEVAEHPKGEFKIASALQLPVEDRLPVEDCFPARASVINDFTPIAWEEMTNIQNGATKLVPSDLVWMVPRIADQALMHFQMGSNGLASGASLEDAILSGLYEIIERDGWTLAQFLSDNCGLMATRTPLAGLGQPFERILARIEQAKLKLHLFDCTNDYQVPVFGALLLDLSGQCAGTFLGYGAHLDAENAALRAITEAAQSRCCYISGARDDLFRRQFLLMKRLDQVKLDRMFSELRTGSALGEYRRIEFPDVKTELRYLLKLLRRTGVSEVYVKEMGSFLEGAFQVVRVMSPQCEPHRFDHWTPTLRCLSYADRRIKELAGVVGNAPMPEPEKGESWKN